MVSSKSEPPIGWYWHLTQDRRVIFILRMPLDDESKLKEYLGHITKPTDESTGHVLKLPPRSFLSNLNVNVE
ncbi:hypothetical protein APHAL10511_000439 [Amanita phalloides]|nr:hypothetical protein APHAL10511_000439 [Amanita phalloides]